MSKLYETTGEIEEVLELIESGEMSEEDLADTLESLNGEIQDKVENILCVIKNLEAEKAAIDEEEKKLKARSKSKGNEIERLKSYLSTNLLKIGKTRVETPRGIISFRSSKQLQILNEEEFVKKYPEYGTVETRYKPSATDIKQAMNLGKEFEGATLIENQNLQIK